MSCIVELCVVDGDQEISKEGGEHGQLGDNLIPLLSRHVDTSGQEGDEGGGGTKDRGLGGCGNDCPELVKEVLSECQSVEQAILMQGLGVVQEEGMADGAQVPDAGD